MVVLEAAAIGAAGYGVYRGGEAATRKGQEALKEHKRERNRASQRKELQQKTKERKDRQSQLSMLRGGSGGGASTTTTSSSSNITTSAMSTTGSSSVLDRMRADHGTSSSKGGRFKSLFKKK